MQSQGTRLWCHLFLNKQHPYFDLVPILIDGCACNFHNMTSVKIRLRGRGSGHPEVDDSEAPVPLMVAVTAKGSDQVRFKTEVVMMVTKLQAVQQLIVVEECQQRLKRESLWWFGEMSKDAEIVLDALLRAWQTAPREETKRWEEQKKKYEENVAEQDQGQPRTKRPRWKREALKSTEGPSGSPVL
jgi:hypothetical protein